MVVILIILLLVFRIFIRWLIEYIFQRRMGRRLLKKGETPDEFQTELYDRITKLEAQVLQRIQKLKTNPKTFICEHFNMDSSQCEPFNQSINYYDRFWKRFLLNEIGKQNVLQFKEQLETFQKKLNKIQTLFSQWERQLQPISKPKRRNKPEEPGRQLCPLCSRSYRDLEILQLHMRVKHRGEVGGDSSEGMRGGIKVQRQQEIFEEEDNDS